MNEPDIRWEQRFKNYQKALTKLSEVIETRSFDDLAELEIEGFIQRFEYTYELAWKTLQDFFKFKGYHDIYGPTSVIKQAFEIGLISNAAIWEQLKKSLELTSHAYNSTTAADIAHKIYYNYYSQFKLLEENLDKQIGLTGN